MKVLCVNLYEGHMCGPIRRSFFGPKCRPGIEGPHFEEGFSKVLEGPQRVPGHIIL